MFDINPAFDQGVVPNAHPRLLAMVDGLSLLVPAIGQLEVAFISAGAATGLWECSFRKEHDLVVSLSKVVCRSLVFLARFLHGLVRRKVGVHVLVLCSVLPARVT